MYNLSGFTQLPILWTSRRCTNFFFFFNCHRTWLLCYVQNKPVDSTSCVSAVFPRIESVYSISVQNKTETKKEKKHFLLYFYWEWDVWMSRENVGRKLIMNDNRKSSSTKKNVRFLEILIKVNALWRKVQKVFSGCVTNVTYIFLYILDTFLQSVWSIAIKF